METALTAFPQAMFVLGLQFFQSMTKKDEAEIEENKTNKQKKDQCGFLMERMKRGNAGKWKREDI